MPVDWTLCQMVQMVREGAISPTELVEEHLREIERRNPAINAFVTVLAEQARAEAQERERAIVEKAPLGLLHGVPVTVKDSFDVAGLPTRVGSRLRTSSPAAEDATAVSRLRAQGAIVLGKTNTPELLASYETDNYLTGRTNHPLDGERTPGGSSGGEAAAIAAFCSPGGLATDGGGSIRVPAHFCGIAGLKPTPGRIPGTGHFPSLGYPGGLVGVAGPMARTPQDVRLLFSAMAGYEPQDPFSSPVPLRKPMAMDVRVGVWEQFYTVGVDPQIRAAVRRAADRLERRGMKVEAWEPRGMERAPNIWGFLFSQWPAAATRKYVECRESEAHWTLLESLSPKEVSGDEVIVNLAARDRMRAALLRQMREVPVLLMPACGILAFRHRERKWNIEGKEIGLFQAMMPSVMANVLGLPAVAVPMGVSEEGLPTGVQLVGRPFEDELVLDLAVSLAESETV